MKYTSIFEKIVHLVSMLSTSWTNFAFLIIIFFIIFLFTKKKISKKVFFILAIISNFILLFYIIATNDIFLGKLGNDIIDNIFQNIYFPSTYAYLFIYLFMNISVLGSLINIKHQSSYKTIHAIFFLIQNFLFALILEIISNNRIEIFKKESLFSNKNLIVLLELSVIVFIFWLLSLMVTYLSNVLTERIILRKEQKMLSKEDEQLLERNSLELENNPLKENIFNTTESYPNNEIPKPSTCQFIPTMPNRTPFVANPQVIMESKPNLNYTNYDEKSSFATTNVSKFNETFDLSSFIPKQQEKTVIPTLNTQDTLNKILTNSLPYLQENKKLELEKDTYTLNDYRIFNKMLKDIKDHNQSNSLTINKDLEYRLITKYSNEKYDLFKRMLKNYSH